MRTKGEIYAGITRPTQAMEPTAVTQMRGVIATLVDNLDELNQYNPHVGRLVAMAQTKLEEACMLSVKAYYLSIAKEK